MDRTAIYPPKSINYHIHIIPYFFIQNILYIFYVHLQSIHIREKAIERKIYKYRETKKEERSKENRKKKLIRETN